MKEELAKQILKEITEYIPQAEIKHKFGEHIIELNTDTLKESHLKNVMSLIETKGQREKIIIGIKHYPISTTLILY